MYKSGKQVSEFSLEGEILGLIIEDGCKLKYLRISSDRGVEYLVKLCKELRAFLSPILTPGLRVQVVGEKELNLKNGKIKLKARSLKLAQGNNGRSREWQNPSHLCDSSSNCKSSSKNPNQNISMSKIRLPEAGRWRSL